MHVSAQRAALLGPIALPLTDWGLTFGLRCVFAAGGGEEITVLDVFCASDAHGGCRTRT